MSGGEDRLQRLEALQQQASETLGLPIEHERVQALASLRLAHESVVERLVHGGAGEHAAMHLLNLSEAIAKLSPVPDVPLPKVEVTIVEGVRGYYRCKHCHQQNFLDPGEYESVKPKPKDYPRTIDGEVASAALASAAPLSAQPLQIEAPEPNPVHPNDLPGKHPGSIHDARLPNGQPAPMRRNDYTGIAADPFGGGTVNGNPFSAYGQPKPDFSAGHPLRDPNDWDVVPK